MNIKKQAPKIATGTLYIVATPIGNLGDITLRAIEVLKECRKILCEDTRHSIKLLQHYGIRAQLISLHQHNEAKRIKEVTGFLQKGEDVALITDAGTPTLSDPGQLLVREVHKLNLKVSPVPGACAAVAAWSASGIGISKKMPGLESGGFTFIGFLPATKSKRERLLSKMRNTELPLIIYEAPHRIQKTLESLKKLFPSSHQVCFAKEITKKHESIQLLPLHEFYARLEDGSMQAKGEWVLIIPPQARESKSSSNSKTRKAEIDRYEVARLMVAELRESLPPARLARIISKVTDLPRNEIYQGL